ncbi:bile acid:sodium symporter [Tribonema minus]|uniref:Bile acid:sodium symporter n=1 Tax=Tribonema minus TaxID=303371 RepID=A0A835YU74_9STRA|nr:bile acid:sodium symporter [Tribonema minus]
MVCLAVIIGLSSELWHLMEKLTGAFPLWVLGAAVVGVSRPAAFNWFTPQYTTLALAFSMTCMGMTLSVNDFRAIAKSPKPVGIGTVLQYTVMPLMGLAVARLFRLPPALAAGVCLVGTCPGGTASNLVALIAGADIALSVLLTAASTVLATAATPLLTRALVGGVVQVSARQLVVSTAQVVFAPVALGLLLASKAQGFTRRLSPYTPLACVALVACICGSVVAQNAAAVAASGARLVAAVATMHAGGFTLGYMAAKAAGLGERASRTVSIEVGMQNSALAVVLARSAFPDPLTALPGAISATVHSVLGSCLAAFWRAKGLDKEQPEGATHASA